MKIEYVPSKREYPKLRELPAGTVFSPIDSMRPYIKLNKDGLSDVFCDSYNILKRNTMELQNVENELNDYSDIIAVVCLETGRLWFMNKDIAVKPLDCTLEVESLND